MTKPLNDVHFSAWRRARPDAQAALMSITLFWAFYFLVTTVRSFVVGFEDPVVMILPRAGVVLFGAVITYLVFLALRPLERMALGWRMMAYFIAAIPASAAYAAWNYTVFYVLPPLDVMLPEHAREPTFAKAVIESSFGWYWFFCAWAAFYLALRYANEVRNAERRTAAWRAEAQSAKIRALRYQVNPHFLFNTLNSLSALILKQRTDDAERMLLNLSQFLRKTLTDDPEQPITLAEELEHQRLYLEVEKVRFGDRLNFDFRLEPGTELLLVPPMILQPIVENAIKYAVAPTRDEVRISLAARRVHDRLEIVIRDTGTAAPGPLDNGLGTGLRNVRARLEAAHGRAARMEVGPADEGGFVVQMSWPVDVIG
ncbi:hypothetical protein B5C34_12795 [Pacificimonas flava]|uniref:Uncharacterized protein n=2 Tax=Pacificimonas TaxID=1960290 RepID=A0A219B8X5_9SPHN|nr:MULTISPECIES: histidine kinase [Pacificimonas]MBZ6378456.1 histidine kinase [Pacificimonas aurantium]OWV34249.1 hypothetical protein B5C34_12795 [Pacificimonas flava]